MALDGRGLPEAVLYLHLVPYLLNADKKEK